MRHHVRQVMERSFAPGGSVLDAGCGAGQDAAWLVDRGHAVVAIDISPGMIAETRLRAPAAEAHVLAVEQAAALGRRFDAALLDFGVLNAADPTAAARALAAVLRPDAALVAVVMPRIPPAWLLWKLGRGEIRACAGRLRRELDLEVEGAAVRTRYLGARAVRRAFGPWFYLEDQAGLGFLLPPPGAGASEAAVARWDRFEAPLRRLPGFRALGDHLLLLLRRTAAPAPG